MQPSPNQAWGYLYDRRWDRERKRYLDKSPLCVHCAEKGLVVPATVVDHKQAHKGDAVLFWQRSNWQSLCKPCHDGWKQALEHAPEQCRADGYTRDDSW